MRTFVAYTVSLAIVVAVVIGLGKLGGFAPSGTASKHKIYITECDTTNEPKGHKKESIVFPQPDVTYRVIFSKAHSSTLGDQYPFTPNEFDITPNGSNEHQLTGPDDCSQKKGCYYYYSLSRLINGVPESPPCNDPGIHIVPN
jgi:hypothetical protein